MRSTLLSVALLFVSAALPASAAAAVSGNYETGGEPGSGHTVVNVENDGPGDLKKLRVKLQGAQHTGATPDPPGAIEPQNPNDFDYTPAEPVPPAGEVSIFVRTDGPVSGVVVQASEDGESFGANEELPPKGDAAPDPPDDTVEECRCADLTLTAKNVRKQLIEDHFQLAIALKWKLNCEGPSGTTCRGTFNVVAPDDPPKREGLSIALTQPKKTVKCKSRGNRCRDRKGTTRVRLRMANSKPGRQAIKRLNARLASKTFTFRVERTCGDKKLADVLITVSFNGKGRIDKKRSDLDGDGNADGKKT